MWIIYMDSSCSSYIREDELSISIMQASKPKHSNIIFSPEAEFMNVQFRWGFRT
jgi:hypothetical protein